MCSLYQSQEVSCFNVDKWNLVTRTAQYDLHKKTKTTVSLSLWARAASCFPVSQQQIWCTGSKQSRVNSAWINHSLLSISLHFTGFLLFFSSLLSISIGVREEEDVVNCGEKAPDLLPPAPEIEMSSLIAGGGCALQYLQTLIISTTKHTASVYIVISAINLYLAHNEEIKPSVFMAS